MEPLELTKEFSRIVWTRDFAGIDSIIAADFVVDEPPSMPYGGRYEGPEGLVALIHRLWGTWDFEDPGPLERIEGVINGDTVVQVGVFRATAKATGRRVSMPFSEVKTIRDCQIARVEVFYWDTNAIAEACRVD